MATPLVPYIASWSEEEPDDPRVVERPGGLGIAYPDEVLGDRDSRGVLWDRMVSRPGCGKPRFARVHTPRQRRAMRMLLCQVCGGPADTDDDGVLWVLRDVAEHWRGWPENMVVSEPPICMPCLGLSTSLCPALRKGHVVVRAGVFTAYGVAGTRYRAGLPAPVPMGQVTVAFHDAAIRWTLASNLARELRECAVVDG